MKRKVNIYLLSGIIICGFLILLILYSSIAVQTTVNEMQVNNRFAKPSMTNLLGTDNFGRDILVRIIAGLWRTLFVAVFTVLLGAMIGFSLGAIAGWYGKGVDVVIMKLIEVITAFPWLLLALIIIAVIGISDLNIIVVLTIVFIPSFTRISRSCLLKHKNLEYVSGARMAGASTLRIIFVHIFPNISTELLAAITIGFANAILSEATLSFLGLGIQPPDPSLGRMLYEAQSYLFKAPWMAIMPGLTIIMLVLVFNNISYGIMQWLNEQHESKEIF